LSNLRAGGPRDRPHDAAFLEAERAVLGAVILQPDAMNIAVDVVKAEYFYRDAHRRIWTHACQLSAQGEPIDLMSLNESLTARANSTRSAGRPTSRRSSTACRAR
jgi:replicative DNA helicase